MTPNPRSLVAFGTCILVASVAVVLTAAVASAAPDPNWANIKINELSSDNGATPVGDAIELYNTGSVAVDITGWLQTDSHAATTAAPFVAKLPDGTTTTTIPANGYVYFGSTQGLSSGGDAVKVYLADLTPVDQVTYGGGEAGTDEANNFGALAYARCPNGTGVLASVTTKSFGASNAAACAHQVVNPNGQTPNDLGPPCAPEGPSLSNRFLPASPLPWPGISVVSTADNQCYFETATGPEGRDVSGLIFSNTEPGVLWAVKNKNWVFKLVKQDGVYVAAPGWAGGKEVFFPGATGLPDTEGITEGPDGLLYVTTERNNAANKIALNSILQLDPNAAGTTLTATKQWDLTSEYPWLQTGSSTQANLGFEGVTYVPDSYLTANGFSDHGATYNPANYPGHGSGLFFAALEDNGNLYAYALYGDGSFTRIAVVPTGLATVQDVAYDPDLQRIWALCDNSCAVTSTLLKIGATGVFVPEQVFSRPAGLPNNNIEGFAVAPASSSSNGLTREVIWSDDGIYGTGVGSSTEGHALYSGSLYLALGYTFDGFKSPLPKTSVNGGSTLPLKFQLQNAVGQPISDTEAQSLVTGVCKITIILVKPAGAVPGCPTYDTASKQFQLNLKTTNAMQGANGVSMTVTIGGTTLITSALEPFTVK